MDPSYSGIKSIAAAWSLAVIIRVVDRPAFGSCWVAIVIEWSGGGHGDGKEDMIAFGAFEYAHDS